jgi:hypothetical protein
MVNYVVRFLFLKESYQVNVTNLADVSSGFWVNDSMEFTKADDNCYWIPPSQLQFVMNLGR